ncbi:MAG: TIGR02302 family protein [Hyphomicrobiales bacterium]
MDHKAITSQSTKYHVSRVIRRARLVVMWEAIWPSIFALLLIVGTYVALSWLGLWAHTSNWMRVCAMVGFGLMSLYVVVKLIRTTFPGNEQVVDRIEHVSGIDHRPLTATLDKLGNENSSNAAQDTLWQAHKKRIFDKLNALRSGFPKSQISSLDPYGLRVLVVLGLFVGFNVAGSDRIARLTDIADFAGTKANIATRLDAWVTPPRYTGKPPIFLTNDAFDADGEPLVVPAGSEITIRSVNSDTTNVVFKQSVPNGEDGVETIISPEADAENSDVASRPVSSAQLDYAMTLEADGILSVATASKTLAWTFTVLPDTAPEISLSEAPEVQRSGALQVVALIKDDYGVNRAVAEFAPVADGVGSDEDAHPLYEAPQFPLSLNRGRVVDGKSKTIRSIVDHPWAGAEMVMILRAFDQLGQQGSSEPVKISLPLRRFVDPLARAVIEQRRNLAMDANYAPILVDVIDVITLRAEQFENKYAAFISLAAIRRGILDARDDDALRQVVDDLWDLAIGLEDGDLSEAERNLRDALEALREGIENGASEEELARLMADARQALQEFMQALAEQAERNADTAQNQPNSDPSQALRPQDLQDMLDRIQELAETGSRDAAQQMLSQLQQMMENLQAQQNQQNQQGQSQAQQMLNELGEMIRRQQQLRDQTFRERNQGQQGEQGPQRGQPGDRGEQQGQQRGEGEGQSGQSLQDGQQSLADQLQQLLDRLGQNGSENGNQLGQAQRSMEGAAQQLGQGQLGEAGGSQSEALSQLRRGAQGLAEQMAGQGEGQGDHNLARGERGTDPLGRREGRAGADFGDDVEVPDEIDTQRARQILDQIRQRLGESLRPKIELEYLERLLQSQ